MRLKEYVDRALHAFHHEFRTEVTVIGEFTEEWTGVRVDGEESRLAGYDHFLTDPSVDPE